MAKKYIFVRMPEDIYRLYKVVQGKMQADVSRFAGKDVKVTMPKVFRAVIDPELNENYIQVDMKKLLRRLRE